MPENIEQKVAETILQKQQEITIGGETYQVAPPTTATLILASEYISQLPAIKLDSNNILIETLYIAKDCHVLGDIVAILILGKKGLREERTINSDKEIVKTKMFGLVTTKEIIKVEEKIIINHQEILAQKLLDEIPPHELNNLMAVLLRKMQISDFFGLTTSLIEINLLRQTREVVTTQFGQ